MLRIFKEDLQYKAVWEHGRPLSLSLDYCLQRDPSAAALTADTTNLKTASQSETMSEAKKGELAIRDKAILHQQRRLKQATQFTHKDSADLLPLDGLKRLGTSKDLVSGLIGNVLPETINEKLVCNLLDWRG